MTDLDPNCGNCRFWRYHYHDDADGHCARYAPRGPASYEGRTWAVTSGGDWCGEHEPRPLPEVPCVVP